MEGDQGKKAAHVCNICSKSFPSGKSLGGHKRFHVMYGKSKPQTKGVSPPNDGDLKKRTSGMDASGHSGYGLRENPKKTWRPGDSSFNPSHQGEFCPECGEGFHSLRSLFGHMSCHTGSKRFSNASRDHSWIDTEQEKLINSSSPVCDIDQVEQVALCLLMLSRDSGYWGSPKIVPKSSDSDSVVLKDSEIVLAGNCDSGCSRSGEKRVRSEAFVDELFGIDKSWYDEEKNGAKMGKGLNGEGCDQANGALVKNELIETSSCSSESPGDCYKTMAHVLDLNLPAPFEGSSSSEADLMQL